MIAAVPFAYNIWGLVLGLYFKRYFDELNIATLTLIDKIFFYVTTYFYVQFGAALIIILGCFCMTVTSLKKILERSFTASSSDTNSGILFKTSIIYEKICEIVGNFSNFYKFMLLPFYMIFLFYVLLFTYGMFIYQMTPNDRLCIFTKLSLSWVCLYSPLVLCLYSFSSIILSESEKIIDLVQLLAAKDRRQSSLKRSIKLALFFTHQKPQMHCELFDVDWKTFSALMGSIFTYTIILVQFYDVSNE